ncbi:hypothetical protein [Lyngbya sp. CCY1209]|uniref:hypothetical protein n=1 Tax=Lyngbya sp. CCY1209 TaxID=2886103 RepID=UPI002D1FF851|nr:hypothetical protein [Lyngbya sp. CCY1209]MEB3882674.1 hypothetical protein [Lyngbya sp. CCY1209]
MSNREGFTSGLILGATLGGLVGGVLGVVLSSRQSGSGEGSGEPLLEGKRNRNKEDKLTPENVETARLNLEDKIAQLNQAIDDVRLQLGGMNGTIAAEPQESSPQEES